VREVMVQHMTQPPPRPSRLATRAPVPPELERLVLDCLEKEPYDRPASIQEVERRLREILEEQPQTGFLNVTATGLRQLHSRRAWVLTGAVSLVLALLASAAVAGWPRTERWPRAARLPPFGRPAAATELAVDWPSPAAARVAIPAARSVEPRDSPAPAARPAPVTSPAPPAAAPRKRARPAIAARPRPAKLDHDVVLNPFE